MSALITRRARLVPNVMADPFPASEAPPPRQQAAGVAPFRFLTDDGNKFPGGFGATEVLIPDYWTLRARSAALFERNIYARGIVRCIVSNVINTGLHLEATPEESLLGYPEDGLADWAETTENRFELWGANPAICDQSERLTFGALQAVAHREALVAGDVLVVLVQDQRTKLPRVRLINGASVQTPLLLESRATIKHGVELDSAGRHVAYWIKQEDGTAKRLPAYGEKSGRRLAWLVYGTDNRLDDVRGKPLLALALQSLKEIDRYRDSVQRKAVLNSMLAMVVTKTEDKPGTRPLTSGGAVRRGVDTVIDTTGKERSFRVADQIPGLVLDELQQGEDVKAFPSTGTDEKFGDFEAAVLSAVAWHFRIPPEIVTMAFTNNYSASQAAINEYKLELNVERTAFGNDFCQPIYMEWLLAEALAARINAPGLLEAWRDFAQFDTFGAWMSADWSGHIKPAVDLTKLATGYEKLINLGLCTRDRASRELTGTKYSKNVQKLARENEQLAEANEPMAALEASKKPAPEPPSADPGGDNIDDEPIDEEDDDTGNAQQKKAS